MSRLRTAAVVLVALAATGAVVWQAAGQQPAAPTAAVAPPSHTAGATGPTAPRTAPTAPPVRLRIPAIAVSARVVRLGVNPDRTVEVPSDPATTGWFRLGPPPGAQGSAVILGHVDSDRGPAVFARLRFLRPGDRLAVRAADGSVAHFRVTGVHTYPNEEFPARRVYGPHGRAHALQLVTCGGAYDARTGYQANVVVYSTWTGTSPGGG